ncbi:hypothetical protein [Photorhabdus akhurstii]|nr:hypothetical protein [Photorhabdus akhurstii]
MSDREGKNSASVSGGLAIYYSFAMDDCFRLSQYVEPLARS